MTLLAVVALLWSSYALTGAIVAIVGDAGVPAFAIRVLEATPRRSGSWVGKAGALIVGVVWLLLAALPQAALMREVLQGRGASLDAFAVVTGAVGTFTWAAFVLWRTGRSAHR